MALNLLPKIASQATISQVLLHMSSPWSYSAKSTPSASAASSSSVVTLNSAAATSFSSSPSGVSSS